MADARMAVSCSLSNNSISRRQALANVEVTGPTAMPGPSRLLTLLNWSTSLIKSRARSRSKSSLIDRYGADSLGSKTCTTVGSPIEVSRKCPSSQTYSSSQTTTLFLPRMMNAKAGS